MSFCVTTYRGQVTAGHNIQIHCAIVGRIKMPPLFIMPTLQHCKYHNIFTRKVERDESSLLSLKNQEKFPFFSYSVVAWCSIDCDRLANTAGDLGPPTRTSSCGYKSSRREMGSLLSRRAGRRPLLTVIGHEQIGRMYVHSCMRMRHISQEHMPAHILVFVVHLYFTATY